MVLQVVLDLREAMERLYLNSKEANSGVMRSIRYTEHLQGKFYEAKSENNQRKAKQAKERHDSEKKKDDLNKLETMAEAKTFKEREEKAQKLRDAGTVAAYLKEEKTRTRRWLAQYSAENRRSRPH